MKSCGSTFPSTATASCSGYGVLPDFVSGRRQGARTVPPQYSLVAGANVSEELPALDPFAKGPYGARWFTIDGFTSC